MTSEITISVVFTDLVGSTEMSSRLGPEATEEVRQVHFSLLRGAHEAHGGTEVKNLGDGLMVIFPSLSKALDGSVAMQQAIGRHNASGGEELGIRIGVSTGDATEEEGDYFGEPVVEAARLCGKADGGQILTTDMVRAMARRSDHDFQSVGELDLKGLPEPVEGYEVAWAPAAASSVIPLPARFAGESAVALCGRTDERGVLEQRWKEVQGGAARAVLLAGEPGIGKTRLATEVAQAAHADGAIVLLGRCDEDVRVPYQPFVEALSHFIDHAPEDLLEAHVKAEGGELTRLLPRLRTKVPSAPEPHQTDPETERYLLFGAVTALLTSASSLAPLFIVLDDLHWGDKQTVVLLRHLVQSIGDASVLLIATYRDTDLSAGDAMTDTLADLRREPTVERVALTGLNDAEVVGFLESMAGHEMDADGIAIGHAVHRESSGNPFFVGELLRHLAESGQIEQEDGRWRASVDVSDIGLPESIREVVGRRVRRLSDEALKILSQAAVMGREFDLSVLTEVAEAREDDVLDVLEEAETAAIVTEVRGAPGRFRFASGLIQQTLYDDVSGTRRARAHRRIAEALEAQCGADPGDRVGELAHHWMEAVVSADATKAVGYARQAGHRALEKLAPDEAVKWFESALELHRGQADASEADGLDLLLELGEAQRQAGIAAFRETLLEASEIAERLDDGDRLVAAALLNNRGMFSSAGRVDEERVAAAEAALARMSTEDSADRARLLGLLGVESLYAGDYDRRRGLSDEAVAIARRLDDPATLLQVLAYRHETIRVPDTLTERAAVLGEARSLTENADDPFWSYWVHSFSAHPAIESGDIAAVDRFHDVARGIAEDIGQPVLRWHAAFHDSFRVLVAGDHEEAERLATEALDKGGEAGEPDAFAIYGTQLLCIRWHEGRLDELVDMLKGAAADNPGIPAYRGAATLALVEAGREDEARDRLREAVAENFEFHQPDNLWLAGMTLWGEVAGRLGDADAAPLLIELLAPYGDQVATTGASIMAPVAHVVGLLHNVLGDQTAAVECLENARSLAQRLEAPFFVARASLELGRVLQERDGPGSSEAAAALDQAAQVAEQHGCAYVATRVQQVRTSS